MQDVKHIHDLDGKSVLVRIDTDVEVVHGKVVDDYRLTAALPTIRYLVKEGASVTLIGHMGRPKGKVVDDLRLTAVARHFTRLLVPGSEVKVHHDQKKGAESPIFGTTYQLGRDVVLLENLRFDPGEEDNEAEFVHLLADGHDYFVNESFATAHREAASTVGVAKKLPSYAGLRLVDEIAHLQLLTQSPDRPLTLIVGGAKVEEKLGLLTHLLPKVDHVLTGGVVTNILLDTQGVDVKKSKLEPGFTELSKELLKKDETDHKILIPTDYVWDMDRIVDIGMQTVMTYKKVLADSKTIFWAGSLGVAEDERFAHGTKAIAEFLAEHKGVRMIGGGDTATALGRFKLLDKMSFVSTGGGAALEYLAGKKLPGIEVLD
jgi:phosphoglycerate kinase